MLDALCRLLDVSVYAALGRNLAGLAPGMIAPDLAGFDIDGWLAAQAPREPHRGAPHGRAGRSDHRRRSGRGQPGRRRPARNPWKRSSRPTVTAGSSSRSAATSIRTSQGCARSPAC
ncbi:MAG: hypothetical protein WDO24_11635 [Pseudomonadota bacterium]